MIKLIKSYPYDNKYDYIKLFGTKAEQTSYFNSFDSITFDEGIEEGYIRERESFIVPLNYDYMVAEGINYMIWNNGYKDLFCFITEKRYSDDENTQIFYEVDVLNTFLFDINLKKSFVERKVCSMDEISDFDEGLEIGEHQVVSDTTMLEKTYEYFAMFNGIKEQSIVFDAYGKFENCVEVPYVSAKPMTLIDGIQYPLYFMPLKESYADVRVVPINPEIVITDGVVGSARKLLGKPYVWGGNYPPLGTSLGTDCSGLCMWAYNDQGLLEAVGIQGRWTTYNMYAKSVAVDILDLAPGDLLFTNFSSPGVPEHVMLVANVNIEKITVIEAQQTGTNILERTLDYKTNIHELRRFNING